MSSKLPSKLLWPPRHEKSSLPSGRVTNRLAYLVGVTLVGRMR